MKKIRYQTEALLALLSFYLLFFFAGCSHNPIKTNNFTGFKQIKKGESATLKWDFEYADRVKIEGVSATFDPKDSLTVRPDTTIKYMITAYQGNVDSTRISARVIVIEEEKKMSEIGSFAESSDYLTGIKPVEGKPDINASKVMRIIRDPLETFFVVRSILIDSQGNFIRGSSQDPSASWWADIECNESLFNFIFEDIKEYNNYDPEGMDISILLDNSASARENALSIKRISDIIPLLKTNDRIKLSGYNQDHFTVFGYSDQEEARWQIENISFPAQNGLNAPYKAAFKELRYMEGTSAKKNILILIAFNSDNSSIIYTPNDVIDQANKTNTAVYVIAMGNAVRTYSYKYITSMTGGRFYYLDEEEFLDFPNILSEIILSQKYYYECVLPVEDVKYQCNKAMANFNFENEISSDSDEFVLYLNPETQYSQYQAVATFDFQSSNVSSSYLNIIRSLANVLIDNPEMKIELIGNSSNEGDPQYNLEISKKRADAVQSILISYGVSPRQIKTRGLGSNKPVYYMDTYDWQQLYNRRVEIRWLDPSLLPYEIVAEFAKTETEAEEKTNKWRERGYRSYYDRYIVENYVVYRVKIWGFPTPEDAREEAAKLDDKYDGYFVVE